MSDRKIAESRTIHPRALKELGEEACIVALGVARDLRSGVIPPEEYDQKSYCGSACCIAGHIATRLGIAKRLPKSHPEALASYQLVADWVFDELNATILGNAALGDLFYMIHPSDPNLAADAIERYVYEYAREPWKVPAMTGD